MDQDRPDLPEDFSDVERRLAAGRPSFSELEFDKIKLRAVAKASRPQRTGGQTKGLALRSRIVRIAVSLVAFGGTAIGGIAAFDALANAAIAQYSPGGSGNCSGATNGNYYLNITAGPTTGPDASNANLGPFTVTEYSCVNGVSAAYTPPAGTTVPVIISCTTTAAEPPSAPAACPATPYFNGSGPGGGTSTTTILITNSNPTPTFYAGFSAGSSPVIVVSGNGLGTKGSSTDPNAGYQAETIQQTAIITSNGENGSSGGGINFSGTGAEASGTITVTVCTVDSFPCASANIVGTPTSPSSANTWGPSTPKLSLTHGTTYYAQAAQDGGTSPVYTFTP